MLLAGQIVGIFALIDLAIGLFGNIIFYSDIFQWRKVAIETPFVGQNEGVIIFLQMTFIGFLATGLLEFLATCSNNRILWWFSLLGKVGLLGCSITIGYYAWANDMRSEEFIEEHVTALVNAYNLSEPVANSVDWIHETHMCCGYRSDHAEWSRIIGPDKVPISCCIDQKMSNCGNKDELTGTWLIRINNAACHKVIWQAYEPWDPVALLLYLVFVYLMWLGVLFTFYKVFLASYLASEVAKYLRSMDTLNE